MRTIPHIIAQDCGTRAQRNLSISDIGSRHGKFERIHSRRNHRHRDHPFPSLGRGALSVRLERGIREGCVEDGKACEIGFRIGLASNRDLIFSSTRWRRPYHVPWIRSLEAGDLLRACSGRYGHRIPPERPFDSQRAVFVFAYGVLIAVRNSQFARRRLLRAVMTVPNPSARGWKLQSHRLAMRSPAGGRLPSRCRSFDHSFPTWRLRPLERLSGRRVRGRRFRERSRIVCR